MYTFTYIYIYIEIDKHIEVGIYRVYMDIDIYIQIIYVLVPEKCHGSTLVYYIWDADGVIPSG